VAPQSTVLMYLDYRTTVSVPSLELGPPPPAPPPPEPGGRGGGVQTACERVGESHFGRLERKLSTLPTLWVAQLRARLLQQHTEFEFRHPSKILFF
jgi:hypothetical protein